MSTLTSVGVAAACCLTLASAARPAERQDGDAAVAAFLARLQGHWLGAGTILGQPAEVEMRWAPVLDGAFARLTWVSRIGPASTARRFEGHAYYGLRSPGTGRAVWVDSSGLTRPIVATVARTGDALVASWGTADTERGETTYHLESPDTVVVVDRVLRPDGTWREFGRTRLARAPAPR
ncbi:MAG: hypothetical protein R2745_20765 [Vicinamibacterales bacterium]